MPGIVPRLLRKTDAGVIFMLHRFPDESLGNQSAHDIADIRAMLGYLRRHDFELVSLRTMYERGARGERLDGAIAFTIDDGYRDHASIAAPLFAEFDCPVTTFLTTGFLDRRIWFWWDQIDFVFRTTPRTALDITLRDGNDAHRADFNSEPAPTTMKLAWTTLPERDAAQSRFTNACKALTEEEKHVAIAKLAAAADVEVPTNAPLAYSPMSWDDARNAERHGMTFGPHTVTHPILARASDTQSRYEIQESWHRLQTELAQPVPVFCYPNGQEGDYGKREMEAIADAGLLGSVIGSGGYATGDDIRDPENRFRVRRFAMPETIADMVQYVTGLERLKDRLRGTG
jgi:peptidoglycan/xylan/chitin deacetylase (PgdA/CDA1 family)